MMTEIIDIPFSQIFPNAADIFHLQGIHDSEETRLRFKDALEQAQQRCSNLAKPVGIIKEISMPEFAKIYFAYGRNTSPGPIEEIHKKASALALFAVTIGSEITDEIRALFESGEFVLGNNIDAAASVVTDNASYWLAEWYKKKLSHKNIDRLSVMPYSPGYCGWDITAQRFLFDILQPEEIGIHLRDSMLMDPLKSVSGVLIGGPAELHLIDDTYPFCSDCRTHSCHDIRSTRLSMPRNH